MGARRDPDDEETGPERTCIVTRDARPPGDLIRFAVGPDGAVVPDIRGRLPGRGAWVLGSAAAVEAAVKRRSFARAFKREVTVAPTLADEVEALLARDAVAALALANKAGLVLAGTFKVEAGLRGERIAALLHATEASPDGIRKLDGAARRAGAEAGREPPPALQFFASAQMDLALGRAHVIHAALLVGGASDAVLFKAARWHAYRVSGLPRKEPSTEPPRPPDPNGTDPIRP